MNELTITGFIAFMKEHGNEDLSYEGQTGMLSAKGCDGTFGGCCAKTFDLTDLVDELENLAR